jgi:hypothetical protein
MDCSYRCSCRGCCEPAGAPLTPVGKKTRKTRVCCIDFRRAALVASRASPVPPAMSKSKSKSGSKLSEKDMEQHREYMKKYKMQSSDLDKHAMQYKDYYELLGIPRDATHTKVGPVP